MFVASSLYNYATSSSAPMKPETATPSNTRVKRHPNKKRTANGSQASLPTSPPPSYASVASGRSRVLNPATAEAHQEAGEETTRLRTTAEAAKIAIIDAIIAQENLYEVLGVKRNAKNDEIRRGFLNRSRVCHPDKFPSYAPCVVAFQKVSFAYQTLSKPSSRRMYDVSGRMDLAAALNDQNGSGLAASPGLGGDETLNSVLYSVFCEFLDGDFEMIRVLVSAMNESNPGLNLGGDAVDSIEGAFAKLREMMLAGKKYLGIIRFELIRLYEIQQSLRQLSYFDVFGRLRLTLQLARVTLSIPMAIDQAMKESEEGEAGDGKDSANTARSTEETQNKRVDEEDDQDGDDGESSGSNTEDEGPTAGEEFGMRAELEDSEDEDGLSGPSISSSRQRRLARARDRTLKRARLEAARKARVVEQEERALQKRGLLGPTAASLLKGVVKVLETSEGWVPGSKRRTDIDD
ncbi:hypothetical protein CBS101457_000404 [Exobasidium rhododendri]|nr:hypothetical protein CBS101457_000404 [Exobasidium rhododendri]